MRHIIYKAMALLLLLMHQAGALTLSPSATTTQTDPQLSARICERFFNQTPAYHLLRHPLDNTISARAWTNFLSSLDFDHMYFLQSDIEKFSSDKLTLDDKLAAGDLSFADDVFTLFKQRVQERYAFTTNLLESGFDLTRKESYQWNRREAPWPATSEACDELWRLKIKNEYLRQIVARQISEEETASSSPADATNTVDSVNQTNDTAAAQQELDLSPEAFIRSRYEQVLNMLNDSDGNWLIERYLTAFAHAYDPHSAYMTASTVEDFDIEMKLSLTGIGALLRAEDGAAKVIRLIPGGPAAMDTRDVRLRAGDKIIAVGQDKKPIVDVLHWPLHRIVSLIRGPKGSRVVLTVIPASDPSGSTTKRVDLVRDEVKLEEQAADSTVRTITDHAGNQRTFGVIRLPAFYANMGHMDPRDPEYRSAAADVATILDSLQTNNIEGVILDLRNNGGGSLLEAIRMTGLFIRTGPTVQVRERHSIRVLPDRDPTVAYAGPLVVLVNSLSASASEIVAGALQDYGRALIVGSRKTHGKGTVQTIIGLGRDPALGKLRITTASYYRISGASTQLRGVMSDIIIPSPFDYMGLGEDSLSNPMPWSAVMPTRFSPVADFDGILPQLRAASEARRKSSERFAAYQQLLHRIEALNDAKELPLALDERLAMARSERELSELQKSLIPEDNESDDTSSDHSDIVLGEALQILADFSETRPATATVSSLSKPDDRNPIIRMFDQLLQAP